MEGAERILPVKEYNAFDQYVPGFGITFLLIAMLMAIGMGLIDGATGARSNASR
jgi:hypothetical protein